MGKGDSAVDHEEVPGLRNRATRTLYRQESVIGRFEPVTPPAGLTVERHPATHAVCRLDRDAPVPD